MQRYIFILDSCYGEYFKENNKILIIYTFYQLVIKIN